MNLLTRQVSKANSLRDIKTCATHDAALIHWGWRSAPRHRVCARGARRVEARCARERFRPMPRRHPRTPVRDTPHPHHESGAHEPGPRTGVASNDRSQMSCIVRGWLHLWLKTTVAMFGDTATRARGIDATIDEGDAQLCQVTSEICDGVFLQRRHQCTPDASQCVRH